MNIKDLKTGMLIKICNDPSLSILKYGGLGGYKKTLGGTIQWIKKIRYSDRRIYIYSPRFSPHVNISFHIKDLRYPDEIEMEEFRESPSDIKPELFDPKQLVIK